jgi:hypothetical protein
VCGVQRKPGIEDSSSDDAFRPDSSQQATFLRERALTSTEEKRKEWRPDMEETQLPLEIQLALLEDNFFGWTHLTSTFLGHTLWPLFCHWITYEPSRHALSRLLAQRGAVDESSRVVESTVWWIEFVSMGFGVLAGLRAFQFIRRRRRVWFRSAYGSRAYHQDRACRRQSVHEADRTNTLGKLIARIQRKRERRRLQKAKARYAKKHLSRASESSLGRNQHLTRRISPFEYTSTELSSSSQAPTTISSIAPLHDQSQRGTDIVSRLPNCTNKSNSESSFVSSTDDLVASLSDDEVIHHSTLWQPTSIKQDHVVIPLINHVAYAHGGFFGVAPFLLASPQWVRILRKLLPDVYIEISRRVLFSRAPRLIHWAENNPVVAAYGVVQYVKQHQHLSERRRIERFPSSSQCKESVSVEKSNDKKQAAISEDKLLPTIEWDVFLDPRLVRRVEAVLDSIDRYLCEQVEMNQHHEGLLPSDQEREDNLVPTKSNNKVMVLTYLDSELKKRAQELTDQLLIAHGNTTQLILEQTGFLKDVNYSRIQRTRQSLGGGMYARQWMAVFAEALRLGTKYDENGDPSSTCTSSMEDMTWLLNDDDGNDDVDACSNYLDYSLDATMADSLQLIQRTTKTQHPMSLVLDLKSRHVPKRVLQVVLDTLHSAGIDIAAIGSFEISEIRGLSNCIDDEIPTGDTSKKNRGMSTRRTKEFMFVHSAGDLKHACHLGLVKPGDHVFFNAGSLINESARTSVLTSACKYLVSLGFDGFDPECIKSGYRLHACTEQEDVGSDDDDHETTLLASVKTLHDCKRLYRFSIGVYVQEFAIDEAAARLLIEHVNEHSQLYDLGFAWGGINGMTVQGIQPGRFTSTDGYWNQRRVGKLWT